MQLLGIHVNSELELCLQCNFLNFKDCDAAFVCQISFMLPFHLRFFLVSGKFFFFVAIQVVLYPLSDNFLHLSFTL